MDRLQTLKTNRANAWIGQNCC